MKLMVYSHDAFGLGNVRRMLAICEHLLETIPHLSILLLSGSPMLQSFRLPKGLDYIKLPCLNRSESGELTSKYLGTDVETTLKLRSDIMLAAARSFQPDMMLVDKKPFGLREELTTTIRYLTCTQPQTKFVLLLRDILDAPEKTIKEWQDHNYFSALDLIYDRILVVGMPEVFDLRQEYAFPVDVANKVEFCGYLRKKPGQVDRGKLRQQLGISRDEKLVLVTPGGGEDGIQLIQNYLTGLTTRSPTFRSLIVTGSEMNPSVRDTLNQMAQNEPSVQIMEFTNDLMSYIDAADLVVCMGGYNTITEVLSQAKRTISVPRIKPGHEQLMRANRMQEFGLLRYLHPSESTPEKLFETVETELQQARLTAVERLDLQGLPKVTQAISRMLFGEPARSVISHSILTPPSPKIQPVIQ
ncbi:glycosyltransferase [Alkalinema sp. FACHB-956]|uniref:glycosyltransferase family protein n=1 Tax=Alkalinema sp. FACHB-956 TaxID=2692768 RepID=UPI0016878F1C|nr:glycosyltransferase [Alkalinema sp. FACHB-956]MBD2325372.1 glycosyltransferase [Alkalinema sp. FACHB-956]